MKYYFGGLTGEIITRDSVKYEESRRSWNRAIEKYPLVFIFCKCNTDVINALRWVNENNIEFRIRSGRHHYEGYSTGNDVAVIDISGMNKIYVNEEDMKVTIDGGVRNRELYERLNSLGYPFPGGGCPTVGVAGYALGGGWGYSSRLLGLGCDNLIEVEMINYKGELVVANLDKNADLFWALRGAGAGNYGVVTSLTFNIPKKIEKATLFGIDFRNIDINEKIGIIETLQNEFKHLDRRMNFKTAIYNSLERGKGIKITGLFYGTKEEAKKIMMPFINIASNCEFSFQNMSVLQVNREIQDSHPEYEKYKSGGRFVVRDYNSNEIKKLIDIIYKRAEGSIYTAITFYGLGGAIRDLKKESTAFTYRDANFIMGFQSVWEDDKYFTCNRGWMVKSFATIENLTSGSFINFPFEEQSNYKDKYYGENKEKLKMIKEKFDPNNIFRFEQSI